MSRSLTARVAFGTVCSVAVLATTVGQTIPATQKAREAAPVVAAKPAKHQSEQVRSPSTHPARKSPIAAGTERQAEAIQLRAKPVPAEVKGMSPKSHRRLKTHRIRVPQAVVQPRTDLMYHGMLESPQRYELRRNHLGTGLPSPQAPELTHDHFQELDRNQDGFIDPIEKAFDRVDMGRDLYNRRPR